MYRWCWLSIAVLLAPSAVVVPPGQRDLLLAGAGPARPGDARTRPRRRLPAAGALHDVPPCQLRPHRRSVHCSLLSVTRRSDRSGRIGSVPLLTAPSSDYPPSDPAPVPVLWRTCSSARRSRWIGSTSPPSNCRISNSAPAGPSPPPGSSSWSASGVSVSACRAEAIARPWKGRPGSRRPSSGAACSMPPIASVVTGHTRGASRACSVSSARTAS